MKIYTPILIGMGMVVTALAIWLSTLIVIANTPTDKLPYMERITGNGVEMMKVIRLNELQAPEDRNLE